MTDVPHPPNPTDLFHEPTACIQALAVQVVEDCGSLVYTGGFTAIEQTIDAPLLNPPSTSRAGPQAIDVEVSELAVTPLAWHSLVNLGLAMASRLEIVRIELT